MSRRHFSATPGERPGRTVRRRSLLRDGGAIVPTQMRQVVSIGRFTKGLYCDRCGHTHKRCICPPAPSDPQQPADD